uniref:WRKY19-like zinc finger domain-containing protein n=1 Tax=Hyaloperonospora arabidopsidis (strain Emoy2) TaxID=559515 RepID=M4C3J9_HYAAE
MTPTTDWRSSTPEQGEYTFLLFQSDASTPSYEEAQYTATTPRTSLSDEDILDKIFQEIMSPQDVPSSSSEVNSPTATSPYHPVLSSTSGLATSNSSAPSTPQLHSTLRRGSIPSASIGTISPNMATSLRVPTFPMSHTTGALRNNTVFFPTLSDAKTSRTNATCLHGSYASMLFTSPTAASRRTYRRTSRSTRLQKKKPASRICRMAGCTKGIRSRGLCKAHGGGRRCTTPGCEISDQGGGHCIAHGGGRRCSISGCQKSAQSKGLCKLHGGARLCRLPDCNKNGQIKGLCRLHYSLTLAGKNAVTIKIAGLMPELELHSSSQSPCDFELRV